MWPAILLLIAFLIFAIILITLFLIPLIIVAINIVILYFLFLRIYTEIKKYGRGNLYLVSAVATVILLFLIKNFLPLWQITTAALLTFVIAHLYLLFKK